MAERQILLNPIGIGRVDQRRACQAAPALRVFGLQQMPLAGAWTEHFSTSGDLEPLRD